MKQNKSRWCGIILFSFFAAAFGQNAVTPDTGNYFKTDPATPHCLGFRMYIKGDVNTNATCTVQYKKNSSSTWLIGIPMLRVRPDTVDFSGINYKCGNLFAGSVLNLEPGTLYNVKFHMADPDGGGKDTTITTATAAYPPYYAGIQTFHVYPRGYGGTKLTPNYDSLQLAIKDATPGTVVLVHPGVYALATVQIDTFHSGTITAPLVIRGATSEGVAYLDCRGILFSLRDQTKYVHIEGFTIRYCQTAVQGGGNTGIVIRNNQILTNYDGIIFRSFNPCTSCFIMNNYILGPIKPWYPYTTGNNYGIIAFGNGMVVCYNTVKRGFWDSFEITGNVPPRQPHNPYNPHCVCVDVYNNYFTEAMDDNIETDYADHNVRVWHNLLMNAHDPLSEQPFLGGPDYIFRNFAFNQIGTGLKMHCQPSGLEVYNNTIFGANFTSITVKTTDGSVMGPQNLHMKNNVFMEYLRGSSAYVSDCGSRDTRTKVDYNGYLNHHSSSGYMLKWQDPKGIFRATDPADMYSQGSGIEQHGVVVDTFAFLKCFIRPQDTITYDSGAVDFRISTAGVAQLVDKGIVIPGITDGYKGTAPDLGALEYGDTVPQFGYLHKDMPIAVLPGMNEKLYRATPQTNRNIPRTLFSNFAVNLPALGTSVYTVSLFDAQGKLVRSVGNVTAGNFKSTWRRMAEREKSFANGLYLVKIVGANQTMQSAVLFVR